MKDTKQKMQMTKLQNEKGALKKLNDKCKQELTDLTTKYTTLQRDNVRLRDDLQKLLGENGLARNTINEINAERLRLQHELEDSKADLKKAHKVLEDHKGEVNDLKEITGAKIASVKKELNQANANLHNEKQASHNKLKKAEAEITRLNMRVEEVSIKLNEITRVT
jgi:chromosome segregation ATPase